MEHRSIFEFISLGVIYMNELRQYTIGDFWNRLLSGVAMAIVVAVTPGAYHCTIYYRSSSTSVIFG
jgi:hypothetical protein